MTSDHSQSDKGAIRSAIESARASQGVSVSRLAKLSGMHRTTLSRFLNGHRDITGDTANRLFEALRLRIVGPNE